MRDWRLGTMGFSYSDWAGVFYPKGLPAGEYLRYYSRYFDTVELDTTFHAVPPPERVRRWAEVTPGEFRFCVKATRVVTHETPADRAVLPLLRFLEVARELGPKLAVVLLQYPPSFSSREMPRLAAFLARLPGDVRAVQGGGGGGGAGAELAGSGEAVWVRWG